MDAGRFQMEADFANYTYDRYNALGTDTRVETLLVAPTFLKVGLFQNVDFQVLCPPTIAVRTDARRRCRDRDGRQRHGMTTYPECRRSPRRTATATWSFA